MSLPRRSTARFSGAKAGILFARPNVSINVNVAFPHLLRHALAAAAFVFALAPGLSSSRLDDQLVPTPHASLPARASDLWLVPSTADPAAKTRTTYRPLADGVKEYRDANYEAARRLVSAPSLESTALAHYAAYYEGLSSLRLSRASDARRTLSALLARTPAGHLSIAVPLAVGEAAEAEGDHAEAVALYERLAGNKTSLNEDVLSRLGRAALAAGDRKKAAEAFLRVYYEFPLTDAATTAASHLASLQDLITRTGYKADMGRAQQLFGARRFAEARSAFQELQRMASGGDREIADLRVAESDFYLKRYAAARDGTRPYLQRGSHQPEARFFHASALRELDEHDEFVAMTRALVQEFPDSSWAEEALNNLGTHYILMNEDELAATAFKELYERYPSGSRAERAAWKYGWWSYKTENHAETVRVFESAAQTFPRSDYRPSWLYWAARSHGKMGDASEASARLRLVQTDYANSYYGRLAGKRLSQRADNAVVEHAVLPASYQGAAPPVANEAAIRLLLANGLYDDALNELRHVQRLHGSSTAIDATIAWAYHQKGELRRAITLMRRAYPQFLTAAQPLPSEILQVIFPLAYWDIIKRHSAARGLDPYLVAALIAQESTFESEARSVANAWGLMQIVPATGRRLARTAGMRRFSTSMLTNPETNIRLGTLHFSRLVKVFGGTHFALASYNAGENRVARWKAERPGIDQDEFIDDIPFPETQNYVKRILGTAEDYRTLYGKGIAKPRPVPAATVKKPAAGAKAPGKPTVKKPATKKTPPAKRRR
jgi:soluble lytic murein transglycosylase